MLERQKRLNFLPKMQSKVTNNCDNPSGTEYKTWGFELLGTYILKKTMKKRFIKRRKTSKKLYKQRME